MPRQRRAYTLLELILTMTVILIATGLLFPTINSMYGQYRLRAGTDTIRAGFINARAHAVEEGRRYRFSVVLGKGNFRIAPDDPAFWSGTPPTIDDEHPALVRDAALPSGLRFTVDDAPVDTRGDSALASVSPSQWTTIATFDSDGTAESPDGKAYVEITLKLEGGGARPMVITLRCLTATSTVKYEALK